MAKGLTWTAAHLRAANTPDDVRTALTEAAGQLGDAPIPVETALSLLEELALDSARQRMDLRAATRVREVLLASVAHDLRNPLNTFAMSAGLLRDDLEAPDFDRTRALGLLSRMDRASLRMQALIEDLLEASRVEAGTIEVTCKPEKASAVVRAAIAKAKPSVTDKGASLEEGPIDEDISVVVDRQRAIEALEKLVAIALKSTGEGGMIRIGVEAATPKVLFTLRATPPRGSSNVPPFDENRGGLSLLIARGLVLAQGGQLGVEMAPDGPRMVASFPTHS